MMDQRPSWIQAVGWLIAPIVLILSVRWLLFEPYVIPSGSMIPHFLVHDHILVNKTKYGLRVPFGKTWLLKWGRPQRGDVVVFRYPENPEVFYVKRVLGLPGETVSMREGVVYINGEPLPQEPHAPKLEEIPEREEEPEEFGDPAAEGDVEGAKPGDEFQYFLENGKYVVRYLNKIESSLDETVIPENHYLMVGDNRDQSNDSRSWGTVPFDNLLGQPVLIWLSCRDTLESAQFLCDPTQLRWPRMMKAL